MLLYFIKLAFRNFKKNRVFSFINVMGLGIALASCILIFDFVSKEWSFDKFHPEYESIYRVKQTIKRPDLPVVESATTFSAVAAELSSSYPSIQTITRIHKPSGDAVLQYDDLLFREEGILGVDSSFFNMFHFKFKYGDAKTAFTYNNAVVITEKVALKYFGDANPLGKPIDIEGAYGFYRQNGYESRITHIVGGVLEELPGNTHLDFNILISLSLYNNLEQQLSNWGDNLYTYVKLKNPSEVASVSEGLDEIIKKYRPADDIQLELQQMQEIHLQSNLANEIAANGSERLVLILSIVAIIILIIACTNYINFSIARSIDRYKEVGIRKIYWANSRQLFFQLLTETFIINIFSILAACILLIMAEPFINNLIQFDLLVKLYTLDFWVALFTILIVATLISGLYPAFHISKFNPKDTLHNNVKQREPKLRRVLVTFQFASSIVAIGCTIVLYNQMDFMQKKDLGIDIANTLVINGPDINIENDSVYNSSFTSFKVEALKLPFVDKISSSNFIPGKEIAGRASGYVRKIGDSEENAATFAFSQIDIDFLSNFDIKVLAGRAFDEAFTSDLQFRQSIIINEKASDLLGFATPDEAIGEKINYRVNSQPTIIGVVENFHQYSMDMPFQPILLEANEKPKNYFYLKFSDDAHLSQIQYLQSQWEKTFAGNSFNYFYLDQYYNRQYQRDNQFMKAFSLFSVLSIIVATMGFFGLIYYLAVSKIQEIGIRKILGAERLDVSVLLSKGFFIYIAIASVISLPFIYYISSEWLLNYAFKIDLAWWMFVLPIVILVLIAGLVVSIQTIRTYNINPSTTLKEQ